MAAKNVLEYARITNLGTNLALKWMCLPVKHEFVMQTFKI